MGLPRKQSRVIVVDGRRYRWLPTYAPAPWCSASCPLGVAVQAEDGAGQRLYAHFQGFRLLRETGWVFPRYGAVLTPAVIADIVRAGLEAGWEPGATGRPPVVLDGEPFLRLPENPNEPPPGSEDDLKRRFLSAEGGEEPPL